MSVPLSPHERSAVVAELRAAGCVFAEDEARLLAASAADELDLAAMVARRAAGHPLEHVLGWAEFCGLRIAVEAGVFVPRRRSEFLARQAVAVGRERLGRRLAGQSRPGGPPVAVDLCCGAGAIGAVLAAELPGVELHAADIDPAAVRCARRNLGPAGVRVHEGDLFDALPGAIAGRVDVLVANAPYVPTPEVPLMPAEARDHEPLGALDGGSDGLDVLRRIAAHAPRWLAPDGGTLLVETTARQAASLVDAFRAARLASRVERSEEEGATVVIGVAGPQGC